MNKKKLLFPHCSINQPKTTTTTKICGVFSIVPKRSLEAVNSMIKPVKWLTCNQTAVFCMSDLLKEGVLGSAKCSPLFPPEVIIRRPQHTIWHKEGVPGSAKCSPLFPKVIIGRLQHSIWHKEGVPGSAKCSPLFPEVIIRRPQHTIWYKEEVLLYHFFLNLKLSLAHFLYIIYRHC